MVTSSTLRDRLGREASSWHARPGVAAVLFLLPLAGAVAIVLTSRQGRLSVLDRRGLRARMAAVLRFAAACLFALLCAWLNGAGRSILALAYLAFGIGCFFVAGEEIAWGERLIERNARGARGDQRAEETTVHNINAVQQFTNLSYFVAGLYGSIVAWIVRGRNTWRTGPVTSSFRPFS